MEPTTTPNVGSSKKSAIIAVIAIVLAILGYLLFMGKGENNGQMMGLEASRTPSTLKELLGASGSQKCTFTESNDVSKSSGVFYAAAGKGRGDFESTVLAGQGAGTVSKNSMIIDGETIYVWQPGTTQGMKMTMNSLPTTGTNQGSASRPDDIAKNFDESHDYDCSSWTSDSSLFTPPSDVEFVDMSAMMQGMQGMQGMPGMQGAGTMPSGMGTAPGAAGKIDAARMPAGVDLKAMCAACDQAGEARADCRASLGCD